MVPSERNMKKQQEYGLYGWLTVKYIQIVKEFRNTPVYSYADGVVLGTHGLYSYNVEGAVLGTLLLYSNAEGAEPMV